MKRLLPIVLGVALAAVIPVADALAAPYASRTLRTGSSGSDVRSLQRYLDRAGEDTTADGQFGPATAASLRAFEQAEDRRANGVASRSDQRLVRSRAATAAEAPPEDDAYAAPVADATLSASGEAVAPADAPEEVQEIIAAGNRIARKPYKYGGGHGRWTDSGYDCSGSVSYALHAAGLLDTALDSSGLACIRGARPRRLGDHPRQRGSRLHDRGRAALRHERAQARRLPLEHPHALPARLRGEAPRGPLTAPWAEVSTRYIQRSRGSRSARIVHTPGP